MPAVRPSRMLQLPANGGSQGPVEEPGFLESIGATFRTVRDDQPGHLNEEEASYYSPHVQALAELTGKSIDSYVSATRGQYVINKSAFFADLAKVRATNPKALQGVAGDQAAFDAAMMNSIKARQARDADTASRAGWVPWIIGGLGGAATDPTSYLPFGGGGKTVAQVALRQAIGNAAVEAVMQPLIAQEREKTGRDLTMPEVAANIGLAAGFGGLLGGGSKFVGDNWDAIKAAPKAAQEQIWAKVIEAVPGLQERLGGKMDWDAIADADLPDVAEAVIGLDNLAPDEKAAIAGLRRDAQIEAMNPYIADGAGVAAHSQGLADAMQRIMDASAGVPVAKLRPAPVSASSGPVPRLKGGTAISTGVVAGDAFSVVKSRIGIVESGGNNAAKNPNSSATGKYQFVTGTWLKLYKARFGTGGLTDAQIAAKRSSVQLQEILMDDLMRANAKALRDNGHAVDAGNLYLAHFAGTGGANALLRADPNASARAVLGDAVVNANPFLKKMRAADVIDWAHRKMTGKGSVSRGNGSVSRTADNDPEAEVRDWIDKELAAVDAERARLDAEEPDAPDIAAMLDEPAPLVAEGQAATILPPRPIEPAARLPDAPPAEVLAILPQLRELVRDRAGNASLSNLPKLAKQMGLPEADVRNGLIALAANREIRMRYKEDGTPLFARLPRDNGPVDIKVFVARNGGLSVDGLSEAGRKGGSKGHALGRGGRDWHKQMVGGAGPLIRKNGISLDEMGEKLHEAGYFGDPNGPRPTEDEVLQAIEESVQGRKKLYPFGEEAPLSKSVLDEMEEYDRIDMRRDFDAAADENGLALDDDGFAQAAEIYMAGEAETVADAIITMINREIEAYQAARFYELGEEAYDAQIEEFLASAREAGFDVDGGFDGPAPDARDASAGSAAIGDGDGQAAPIVAQELDPDDFKPFDDPAEGSGAATQIASMEHDLRAMAGRFGTLTVGDDIYDGARLLIYQPDDPAKASSNMLMWLGDDGVAELSIDGLEGVSQQNAKAVNRFGPAEVRDVMRQITKLFPEIRSFSGERLTGAGAGRLQRIDIPASRETIDNSRETHISDQVGEALLADGWEKSGREFSKRFENMAQPGQLSDGSRIVSLRMDETGRWLERLDGWDVANDVDLRRFPNDPEGAIRAVLAKRETQDVSRELQSSADVMREIEIAVEQYRQERGSDPSIDAMYGPTSASPDPDRFLARYLESGALRYLPNGSAKDRLMASSVRDMETGEVIAAVDEIRGGHIWQIREQSSDDLFGGPTQAEKRAALERRGEGGLGNGVTQKPVGSDGGLFDPDAWAQSDFRMDADGDVVNPADLLAQLEAEDAIIKTIKDCL